MESPQLRSCTAELHHKNVDVALIAVANERAPSVASHNDVVLAVELHRTCFLRKDCSTLNREQPRSCTAELHPEKITVPPIAEATERAPSVASHNDVVRAVELHRACVVLIVRSSLQNPQHRSCTAQLHKKEVGEALVAEAIESAPSVASHNDVVGAVELHRSYVVHTARSTLIRPQHASVEGALDVSSPGLGKQVGAVHLGPVTVRRRQRGRAEPELLGLKAENLPRASAILVQAVQVR